MAEEWRAVVGYEGLYEVSNEGRVRSVDRSVHALSRSRNSIIKLYKGVDLCPSVTSYGYHTVQIRRGNNRFVHSLVAEAFIGPKPKGLCIRHLDGNRKNNRASNLAYGTYKENCDDKILHGTMNYGMVNGQSKLTDELVAALRSGAMSKKEVSLIAGCTMSNLDYVVSGKTWKHVK